jgi:hypothetical protein
MRRLAAVLVLLATGAAAAHAAPVPTPSRAYALEPSALAPRLLALDTDSRISEAEAAAPAEESPHRGRLSDVGRSLVLPGWGQLNAGYRTLGTIFLAAEAAIWTGFAVSIAKGEMRKDTYEETAQLFAGIDLNQVSDEFRSLVGQYESSDEYNRLVVYRDAAAMYYGDFENYNRYIEENSLTGAQTWQWSSAQKFEQYAAERRSSEGAFHDAQFMVGLAVVNRVASAVVAARLAPRQSEPEGEAKGISSRPRWDFAVGPTGELEPRLAWELRFH